MALCIVCILDKKLSHGLVSDKNSCFCLVLFCLITWLVSKSNMVQDKLFRQVSLMFSESNASCNKIDWIWRIYLSPLKPSSNTTFEFPHFPSFFHSHLSQTPKQGLSLIICDSSWCIVDKQDEWAMSVYFFA